MGVGGVFATAAQVRIMLHIRKDLDRSKNVSAARVDIECFPPSAVHAWVNFNRTRIRQRMRGENPASSGFTTDYRTSSTMRWNILMPASMICPNWRAMMLTAATISIRATPTQQTAQSNK